MMAGDLAYDVGMRLYDLWLRVFRWLSDNSAAHSTAILVFITGWYAILTYRMARAMNLQTRALVQPVLTIHIDVAEGEFYPRGRFEVKNLGNQPATILDIRLECRLPNIINLHDDHLMYERHIVPPGEGIAFAFDFLKRYEQIGVNTWSPGIATFNLEVVATDLSQQVVLTYRTYDYWSNLTVVKGMPLRVRWRFFSAPFRPWYWRIRYKLNLKPTPKKRP
jgi:hypothetical protein